MSSPSFLPGRRLRLELSAREAEELFFYLHRIVDAFWDAYEDVLMEGYWSDEESRKHEELLAAARDNHDPFSDRHIPY